jgi:hypothetical protein
MKGIRIMEKTVIIGMRGVTNMRNIVLTVLITVFLSIPLTVYSGVLDKPYTPTRQEWLELSITKIIKDRTDVWKLRISSMVWAREDDEGKAIYITISSSNGQDEPSSRVKQDYIDIVEGDVEGFIKRYQWAKDFEVSVQFDLLSNH